MGERAFALRGSFAVFPLELVLGLLGEARATGVLRAGDVALEVTDGRPTAASHPGMTSDMVIVELADPQAPSFEFTAAPTGAPNLTLSMDELRIRVRRERDAVSEIRKIIPSDRCQFVISTRGTESDGFMVTPAQLRVLRAIEGRRRDVTRVASASELDRRTALADLARLVKEGIIDVLPPELQPRRARTVAAPKPAGPKSAAPQPAAIAEPAVDERLAALQVQPPPPTVRPPEPAAVAEISVEPPAAFAFEPEPRHERPALLVGANEAPSAAPQPESSLQEPPAADKTSFFVSHYMPADVTVLGIRAPRASKVKEKALFGLFEIFAPKPKAAAAAAEDPPSSPRYLAALINAMLFGFVGANEELRETELRELIAKAPAMEPPLVVADGKIAIDDKNADTYRSARAVAHLRAIIRDLFSGADQVHGGDHARRVLDAAVGQVWGGRPELRREAARIVGLGPALTARLVIEKGGSGGPFDLGNATHAVGRSSTNDIVLHDPSVSRKHARLEARAGHFVLSDEGSSAGTLVNDQPISGERVLKSGDKIALGDVLLRFEQS